MYTNLRLDEMLQELNDSKDQEAKLRFQVAKNPIYEYYLREAFSFFEWMDFPIEDYRKYVGAWGSVHWSVAPIKALSKPTVDLIEKVIKSDAVSSTSRNQKTIFFLSNLCNEESRAVYACLTKNLQEFYPNITTDLIFSVYPDLEVKEAE